MADYKAIFSEPTNKWFQKTFKEPTEVQKNAWPAIADGNHTLVSAPTGTGKTLSAFLYFIDHLKLKSREGQLKEELYLIYVSPLKSLAGDIRENLNRPLKGISDQEEQSEITVAIRTGDTPGRDRQRMIKHPPNILIITPESLFLMLTSKNGRNILATARAIILDELHAMIDTKRGAHLMLSIARLDKLCQAPLQRIGLSATIEPLTLAAEYLAPEPVTIVAPAMEKKVKILINGAMSTGGSRRKDPVWEDLAKAVYKQCLQSKSVMAFCEARRFAEKLANYVNELGGEGFAKVHHGSLAKEQRLEAEQDLRDGKLRLLCATSSMELGIDVGDIDQVLQIGCPRTISSTMQRLGRAGHNPNRVSIMHMYPRTAPESLFCGMTAQVARAGGVELAAPPRLCLDVLAQHLVSMAAVSVYTVEDVLEITGRAYSFLEITKEDIKDLLVMLAGDYEHKQEIPVRPRLLYDRIHETVMGDTYSRLLAVAAGGTIPDKGLYGVKTEDGVLLGELDEEFVYETRLGDTFLLGAFAWRITGQNKDTVIVKQAPIEGARLPFWKGEIKGRDVRTSRAFGRILRKLSDALNQDSLLTELMEMGLDQDAADSAADFIQRQISVTEVLPDDRRIIIERFRDQSGTHQLMVHSLFGRRVNTPLALLVQQAAIRICGTNIGCVDEEDGFLLYPYGEEILPEGLLYQINQSTVREMLEAILPETPVFSMTFRYNAARALMMGMKQNGRTPLWLQRLRSTQMMDRLLAYPDHPLVRETRKECMEELWDIRGVMEVLDGIRTGGIEVREMWVETPSPMSLPLQWQIEAAEMYTYTPTTQGIRQTVYEELKAIDQLKPSPEELERLKERKKLPENEEQLHGLLMMEGDLIAGELELPIEWLETLAVQERVLYIEPGLWIAAEQEEEYVETLQNQNGNAARDVIRRMLYYRGAQSAQQISERYFLPLTFVEDLLMELTIDESLVEDEGVYYHGRLYSRAQKATINNMRTQAVTQPAERYAALMARRITRQAAEFQMKQIMEGYAGKVFTPQIWEGVILPRRVRNYKELMLDKLLASGEFFWQMLPGGTVRFCRYEDVDWDGESVYLTEELEEDETRLYQELQKRGASFLQTLSRVFPEGDVQEILFRLVKKGLVCADSFGPVRKLLSKDKLKKATVRQRVNVRVMMLSDGRWDIVRPLKRKSLEDLLQQFIGENVILCRETFRKSMAEYENEPEEDFTWMEALQILRIWEYTGKVRRGYFVKGMSGAQFIRSEDYHSVVRELDLKDPEGSREKEIFWLNAADPGQIWGKVLEQMEGSSFINVPGTLVVLQDGIPAVILERQGKTLRVLEYENLNRIMKQFAAEFQSKILFPGQKRLIIKEYPQEAAESLRSAGFMKEMQDYVLYR